MRRSVLSIVAAVAVLATASLAHADSLLLAGASLDHALATVSVTGNGRHAAQERPVWALWGGGLLAIGFTARRRMR